MIEKIDNSYILIIEIFSALCFRKRYYDMDIIFSMMILNYLASIKFPLRSCNIKHFSKRKELFEKMSYLNQQ